MRRFPVLAVLLGASAGLVGLSPGSSASAASPAASAAVVERVVVQSSSAPAAARAVERAGGRVLHLLPIVDGVSAELPAGTVLPGATVTPDAPVTTDGVGDTPDAGTKSVYRYELRADQLPPATPGRPVAVAVVDTGISPVGGLADNLLPVPDPTEQGAAPVACANFSSEPTCDDSYGHGTFLAGLIAGDDGMAPSAKLVAIKIAGRSGAADVSQVLAGIQYAVSFASDLNIRVLNLSLGTDSTHDSRYDPLNRAVERAWQAGLTVVVSASNRGPLAGTISKPGDDPLVVTVGAVDDRETPSRTDDTVPRFSSRGPVTTPTGTLAKPDVVAPGVGLISLDVPGSAIDRTAGPSSYPVAGFRRGSGTSQATAVVSGAVALLLERRPELGPDQVKARLKGTATPVTGAGPDTVGSGLVDLAAALADERPVAAQPVPSVAPSYDSLDASRGRVLVTGLGCGLLGDTYRAFVDPRCDHVHGDATAQAGALGLGPARFDADRFAEDPWNGTSWYSSQWAQGTSWYGTSWYGTSWYGTSWYSTDQPSREGDRTPFGVVLPGSAWLGVWG